MRHAIRGSNNANRSNNNSVYKRREREKMGTQVLILPIMERKSFNVNRNICIKSEPFKLQQREKRNRKTNNKKKKEKQKKKQAYKSIYIFPFYQ